MIVGDSSDLLKVPLVVDKKTGETVEDFNVVVVEVVVEVVVDLKVDTKEVEVLKGFDSPLDKTENLGR